MPRGKDHTALLGKEYPGTRLTILERGPDYVDLHGRRFQMYWCQCSCGSKKKRIRIDAIIDLRTRSCGCLNRENIREFNKVGIPMVRTRDKEYYRGWDVIPQYNDF